MLKRAIIGPLRLFRETARGQFPVSQMKGEAIAACTLVGTRFIRARAVLFVLLQFAVYGSHNTIISL